jgi:RimJ/RimL family protein N-acetyltransferase
VKVVWANAGDPLNRTIGDYVSRKLYGSPGAFKDYTAMGVMDGGKAIAGMLFYDFDRKAGVIQVSGAAETPRWLTKPVLWEMFRYPFDEIGCQALVMRVDPDDKRLGRILTAYGFVKHLIPRLRGRDKAEALYVLYDDVWRLNGFHKEHR